MNTYTIDVPPSANALWKICSGGIRKTDKYRQWLSVARWQVKLQHDGDPLDGPASVSLSLRRPRKNADIDNRIKPVLDALEGGGALVNDKQVTMVCAAWGDHDGCIVRVSPDVGTAA